MFQEKRIANEEVQKFDDLLMQQREMFAEEEIKSSFPRLVSFVLQVRRLGEHPCQALLETGKVYSLHTHLLSYWFRLSWPWLKPPEEVWRSMKALLKTW